MKKNYIKSLHKIVVDMMKNVKDYIDQIYEKLNGKRFLYRDNYKILVKFLASFKKKIEWDGILRSEAKNSNPREKSIKNDNFSKGSFCELICLKIFPFFIDAIKPSYDIVIKIDNVLTYFDVKLYDDIRNNNLIKSLKEHRDRKGIAKYVILFNPIVEGKDNFYVKFDGIYDIDECLKNNFIRI